MPMLTQSFDGGANGAAIGWESTESEGAPMWLAGSGTAVYTRTNPIRGAASAVVTNNTGQSQAALVLNLPDGVTEARVHAYVRVPSTASGVGVMYVSMQNGGAHIVIGGDGALSMTTWDQVANVGGLTGTASPAGVVAAGALVRLSARVSIGTGTIYAAAYSGDATTPVWSTSGPLPASVAGDTVGNVQFGVTTGGGTATSVTLDSVRVEHGAGTSSAFLPPDTPGITRHRQTWVHMGNVWRNVGTGRTVPVT